VLPAFERCRKFLYQGTFIVTPQIFELLRLACQHQIYGISSDRGGRTLLIDSLSEASNEAKFKRASFKLGQFAPPEKSGLSN
jgi:hypothetical protein